MVVATSKSPATGIKRRRNSSAKKVQPVKRRRRSIYMKQLSFHDDEGDTVTFRLQEVDSKKVLCERVNGKVTVECVTKLMIDQNSGRVVDDDGPNDCFRFKELNRLAGLRALAEEAGITVDWIAKMPDVIEEPVKPAAPEPVMMLPASFSNPIEEPVKKSSSPKKPKRRAVRKRRKVWEPITFETKNGDKVTFSFVNSFMQESVNGNVTVEKLTYLSLNTATGRIEDRADKTRGFTVQDADRLGQLRDMACRGGAMGLRLYWATEAPEPEVWCSIM